MVLRPLIHRFLSWKRWVSEISDLVAYMYLISPQCLLKFLGSHWQVRWRFKAHLWPGRPGWWDPGSQVTLWSQYEQKSPLNSIFWYSGMTWRCPLPATVPWTRSPTSSGTTWPRWCSWASEPNPAPGVPAGQPQHTQGETQGVLPVWLWHCR